MMKNIFLAIFLLFGAAVAPAFAQTDAAADKQAAISELVGLINSDNRSEDLMRAMSAQFEAGHEAMLEELLASETALTAAEKDQLRLTMGKDGAARLKAFQEKLMAKIQLKEMMTEVITVVYDKNFTLAEIRDLLTFYRSPTGQKTLKNAPDVAADSMRLTSERLLVKLPAILREMQEEDRRETRQRINAGKAKPKTD